MLDTTTVVEIPRIARTTRATARLMVRQSRARAGIVGLLHLPRHDTFLDEDTPRTTARAVHAMRRPYLFIMLPTRAVEVLPLLVGDILAVDEVLKG